MPSDTPAERAKNRKVEKVLGEFTSGTLKSSSGAKVTSKDQALAIALSEAGRSKKKRARKGRTILSGRR